MSLAGLFVFAVAYLAIVIMPGPGVTALAPARPGARNTWRAGLHRGFRHRLSLVWFAVAAAGLAVVAAAFAPVFVVIRYAGAALSSLPRLKLWNAPARSADAEADISPAGATVSSSRASPSISAIPR